MLYQRKFTNNPNISHSSLKTVYVNKMTKISEFDSWTNQVQLGRQQASRIKKGYRNFRSWADSTLQRVMRGLFCAQQNLNRVNPISIGVCDIFVLFFDEKLDILLIVAVRQFVNNVSFYCYTSKWGSVIGQIESLPAYV